MTPRLLTTHFELRLTFCVFPSCLRRVTSVALLIGTWAALISAAALGQDWDGDGTNLYYDGGNVGIDESAPQHALHVGDVSRFDGQIGVRMNPVAELGDHAVFGGDNKTPNHDTNVILRYIGAEQYRGPKVVFLIDDADQEFNLKGQRNSTSFTQFNIRHRDNENEWWHDAFSVEAKRSSKNIKIRFADQMHINSTWSWGNIDFFNNKVTITPAGKVGIGATSPSKKLTVDGHIGATEVVVQPEWSDFVFDKGYDLPMLDEVKAHIDERGHLPNIPSAEEVGREGVRLGEMDAKLLQKIEELTLYAIEREEQAEAQQERITELEARNAAQKEQVEQQRRRIDRLERLVREMKEEAQ